MIDKEVRLIDANELIGDFKNDLINYQVEALCGNIHDSILISAVIEKIEDAPTIDAQFAKHGQWILHTKRIVDVDIKLPTECSECGFEEFSAEKYNFCPECGAKMLK